MQIVAESRAERRICHARLAKCSGRDTMHMPTQPDPGSGDRTANNRPLGYPKTRAGLSVVRPMTFARVA
jgi:hypothetical protein